MYVCVPSFPFLLFMQQDQLGVLFFKIFYLGSTWLAQSVEHTNLHLKVVSYLEMSSVQALHPVRGNLGLPVVGS